MLCPNLQRSMSERCTDQGRIEDNILITKDGSENLTPTIKDPDELEKIIQAS